MKSLFSDNFGGKKHSYEGGGGGNTVNYTKIPGKFEPLEVLFTCFCMYSSSKAILVQLVSV